jgi:hypothetical protein
VELKAHVRSHGLLPPRGDPSGLGKWVINQREGKKAMDEGKGASKRHGMTPESAAALERVPGWAWAAGPKRRREAPAATAGVGCKRPICPEEQA